MPPLNAPDISCGLINRIPGEITTRPRTDTQPGLINSVPEKEISPDNTSESSGLINRLS